MMLNKAMQDSRLSFADRGVLSYMASLPDDWKFSIPRIAAQGLEGETRVARSIRRLIELGYLSRKPIHRDGRFQGYDYTILATSNGTKGEGYGE